MHKIAAFVSKTNLDWLIPINELKTLDTGICDVLNFQRMTHNDEFGGDVMYGWSEGSTDLRKHCVAPLVHVLVSNRLSHAVVSNRSKDKPLPAVFIMPSTPRSMDWVIVLHLFAYERPQEFAFTESRGLLKVNQDSPVYKHWAVDNVSMEWLGETVAPNYCYGLFPAEPRPAPLGVDKDLTVEVARQGCIVREYWADWMAVSSERKCGIDIDDVFAQVREVEESIQAIGSDERLFKVMPSNAKEIAHHVVESTGRDLFDAIRTASDSNLIAFFSQAGDLRYLADIKGCLIDLSEGIGKDIADLSKGSGARTTGDGIDVVSGSKRIVEVVPVGTKLKAEFYDLAKFINANRPKPGMADIPSQTRLGNREAYHYSPYCSPIKNILEKSNVLLYAQGAGLVIVTLNDDFNQLVTICDSSGHEICISKGMGNDIARAFGGVIGRNAQK